MIVHYDEAQLETKKLFTCGFDLEFFLIQVSIKKIKKLANYTSRNCQHKKISQSNRKWI